MQAFILSRATALTLLVLLIAAFMVVPIFVVVPISFTAGQSIAFPPIGYGLRHYETFFTDGRWLGALTNSVVVAFATAVLTLLIVTPASIAMVRYSFSGKSFFRILFMLPLVVPTIVLALGYYFYFAVVGLLHARAGIIVAHTVGAMPITFLVTTAALKGFDITLERAAASLGADPLRVFFYVTLPVLRPGFIVAALFSFIYSFDETIIAIFITGRETVTLPKRIFESIALEADPVIAVVSTILLLAAILFSLLIGLMQANSYKKDGPR